MEQYRKMWEDFGAGKARIYSRYKFVPTHRVGLTNYLREQTIFSFLKPQATDIVLDAGCAAGRQLFQVAYRIKKGYGTDISQSFIEQARITKDEANFENLQFQQAEIEGLPFEDTFFDKVICAEVLEHVHNKDKALRELRRVLKPGGILAISVPNMNADATLWGRLLRLLGIRKFTPLTKFSEEEIHKHGDAHVREFTKASLSEWLENNGFAVENITSVSFIDGPKFDFFLKLPLHVTLLRKLIIRIERILSAVGLPFGRHLVVRVQKK